VCKTVCFGCSLPGMRSLSAHLRRPRILGVHAARIARKVHACKCCTFAEKHERTDSSDFNQNTRVWQLRAAGGRAGGGGGGGGGREGGGLLLGSRYFATSFRASKADPRFNHRQNTQPESRVLGALA